jgi:serine protease DegQ
MFKLWVSLLLALSTPRTQTLDIARVNQVSDVSVIVRAKEYTVNPKTYALKYSLGGCSGVYINPTTVLTAAHCFESPVLHIWIRSQGAHSRSAALIKINPELDLALLAVEGPVNHVYARLAKDSRAGEGVINIGNPYNFEFLASEGIVAQVSYKMKEFKGHYLVTTAMINPGSSGGGVFNENGELLGINTMTIGGLFGWAGISLAVDANTIRKFLR